MEVPADALWTELDGGIGQEGKEKKIKLSIKAVGWCGAKGGWGEKTLGFEEVESCTLKLRK